MSIFRSFLLTLILILPLFASDKTTIFILHSYAQEYPWTKSQHEAFVKTLQEHQNKFEIYTEHLDTKRVSFTNSYQEIFSNYLIDKYDFSAIDAVYVTDDNALTFLYNNYDKLFKETHKTPIFFSGVNNLQMDNTLDKEIFVGVYEVKELAQNIELIKQFSPQTRNIYILGDNSKTYQSIKRLIQNEEIKFDTIKFHYINDKNISTIQSQLPTKSRNFVLLTTIGNFKDNNNKTLLVEESIKRIKDNPNIVLLTMEDAYMFDGVIGGYVTSGASQGKESAKLIHQYLAQNSLKNIQSVKKSPNIYMFNSRELSNARIYLSDYISRESTFTNVDSNFIEQNQSVLLSTFVTLLMIFVIIIVLMYVFFTQKLKSQPFKSVQKELENVTFKLNSKDQFINNVINLGHITYWRLDTEKNKLYLSTSLCKKLLIDQAIYQNDVEAVSYFIHEHDKTLYKKNLDSVIKNKKSITFKHQMVSTEKEIFNVTQMIYTQYKKHDATPIIIGIIEFEN